MILEKICIQEFLEGGALSIDKLIEERAQLIEERALVKLFGMEVAFLCFPVSMAAQI